MASTHQSLNEMFAENYAATRQKVKIIGDPVSFLLEGKTAF